MKKLFVLSAIASLSLFSSSFTGNTAGFEGKVHFDISVSGGQMPPEAMAMFAGSELTIFIKGMRSRSEMNMGFQNSITISDGKTNTAVSLMDVMGNKYMIKSDNSKEEDKSADVTVKELDETKEIAGYKCKKAEITYKDKSGNPMVTTVFYSEDISNQMGYDKKNYQFKGIKGMPLEYEINADRGMKLKMTATSVTKESVPDSKFEIPSGYKETTPEEMQKDMMKMMQQH